MIRREEGETDEEWGFLRNGNIFCSRKRRRTEIRKQICATNTRRFYELVPHIDEDSYDREEYEEEYYQLILEKEPTNPPQTQVYDIPMTPRTSPDSQARPNISSQCFQINQSSSNSQSIMTPIHKNTSSVPIKSSQFIHRRHIMVGDDVKLTVFHGNGYKDLKKYWFLCE